MCENSGVVTLVVFSGAADFLLTQKLVYVNSFIHPSIYPPTHLFSERERLRKQELKRANSSLKRANGTEQERERERDDAVRAVIDVRTAWKEARHLGPFSLPLPALTDCHQHH